MLVYIKTENRRAFKENQKVHNNELLISTGEKRNYSRNLLKAQLQVSKIQLSLDRAISDLNIVNIELVSLLKWILKQN
jgi:hypothetical protein